MTLTDLECHFCCVKHTAVWKVMVLYTVGLLNTVRSILRKSLHVHEISSRSSAYIKTPKINASNMTTTSRGRKLNIISLTQLWERINESTADGSHSWIFAEVVYNWCRHEIPRYTGILVFLRWYVIIVHFLIPRIPIYGLLNSGNSDDLEWHPRTFSYFKSSQMGFFVQLCSRWQDFNLYSASMRSLCDSQASCPIKPLCTVTCR